MKKLAAKAMFMSFCTGVLLMAEGTYIRDGYSTSIIVINGIFLAFNALSAVLYFFDLSDKLKKDEVCSVQKT